VQAQRVVAGERRGAVEQGGGVVLADPRVVALRHRCAAQQRRFGDAAQAQIVEQRAEIAHRGRGAMGAGAGVCGHGD
jgi:hypothetical protein